MAAALEGQPGGGMARYRPRKDGRKLATLGETQVNDAARTVARLSLPGSFRRNASKGRQGWTVTTWNGAPITRQPPRRFAGLRLR